MRSNFIASLFQNVAVLLVLAFAAHPVQAHDSADSFPASPQAPTASAPVEVVTGTVTELVVDNRVSGLTARYVALQLDDGHKLALNGSGVDQLAQGARVQATGQRAGDTLFVTAYHAVAGPAATPRATRVRATAQAQGTLGMVHADNFDQGRSTYSLVVRDSDGRATPLLLAVIPDTLRIGMQVVATGTPAIDGISLDVSNITILASPPPQSNDSLATPITNRVLVVLVQFPGGGTPAFSQAQVDQTMRTDSASVTNYYQEASYGQQLLNVTVTPWLLSASTSPSTCDFTAIGNAGDAAAIAAGFVPANYQNRFYVFPFRGDCGWAGLAYVGYGQAWSNGYNLLNVYAHELGHNFGLLHAASLYCTGQVIGGSCGSAEYGDPFDVMGNISAMHFNAAQKSILNWIPAAAVRTHTTGSATYTLSPIESAGATTYAVKVPAAANRTYWLEYRQPIGFDSGMSSYPNNGAQIRVSSPFEGICGGCADDTELLDMTPGTANNFGDGALIVGQTYVDSNYGTTISVLTANASALTVQVTVPGGSPTTTTLASSLNPSTAGASVTFTATVTGSAPTGSVNFKDGGTSITGCAAAIVSGIGNSRTATCATSGLSVGTHSVVASYSGDAANSSSNSPPLSQVVNSFVTPTTTTLTGSPNPSLVGGNVTFTATVSGAAPTGSVNFQDGGVSIGGCAASVVSGAGNSRTATCSTSALAVGSHSIVGSYSGDAGNAASSSPVLTQVVNNASGSSNVALASAGAVASASSTYSGAYPVAAVNDNERAGVNWANGGGGWASGTNPPAWVQINFNGSKTIDRVVVYTLQDNLLNPIEPTDTLTFTQYGVTDFTVQGWNGSAWVTLGSVSGNNLVKRTVSFTAFTTDQIRINVTGALYGLARIIEIEAWGN